MLDNIPTTGAGGVTAAVVAGLAALYGVWRRLKSDNSTDKLDAKSQQLIDNIEEQLKRETEEKIRLSNVIERLAAERNEAVSQVGKLEATVQNLDDRITRMTGEVTRLEEENEKLTDIIQSMVAKVEGLSNEVLKLVTKNGELMSLLQLQGIVTK